MRLLNVMLAVSVVCLSSAATTAEAQTINACVMKNGILKVLDDGAECLPRETPITLGQPQQPAVEMARVFDGNGRDIGAFVDARFRQVPTVPAFVPWGVLLREVGAIVVIQPDTGLLSWSPSIRFSELDCEGRGYLPSGGSNTLVPNPLSEGTWLVGSTKEAVTLEIRSILNSEGICENLGYTAEAYLYVPVEEFNQDLGITFPLPLPLWIGSSSDSP
jgi:hypothetical protein